MGRILVPLSPLLALLLVFGSTSAQSCPSFFTGTDCLEIECVNGGYRDATKNVCICPSGYLGIHCEAVKTSLPPDNHFKASGTSFNILNINLFTQYWGKKTYSNIQDALGDHFEAFSSGYDKYNLLQTNSAPYLDNLDLPVYDIQFADLSSNNSKFTLNAFKDTGLYWCYSVPIYQKLIDMIRAASLRNTVITIVTQHPPSADAFDEARETAVAFGIRVNVLWIKDDTFNRCRDDQCRADIETFRTFVDITGGLFVQLHAEENDAATRNLVAQVLLTHYRPQYVSIQSFADCSGGKNVPLAIDPLVKAPYNFVFLGDNANPTVDSFRACTLGQPLRSADGQLAIFQSPNPTCTTLTISANSSCTAIVFTNAANDGPIDLAVYTTYVDDLTVDASRYAIIETIPFYPAFHVEAQGATSVTVNSIFGGSFEGSQDHALIRRMPAAYEWVPTEPIVCDASQTSSLFLNITIDGSTVQRAVRVACVPIPTVTTSAAPTTTAAPTTSEAADSSTSTSSSVPSTTIAPTTSEAQPSTVTTSTSTDTSSTSENPDQYCDLGESPSTFLFAYATDFNLDTFAQTKSTIVQAVSGDQRDYTSLGNVRFDMKTADPIFYRGTALDFANQCQANQPNATLAADAIKESDVLDVVRNFLRPEYTNVTLESSVLVILVNRLPKTGDDLTDEQYDALTNKNIKIFPIISLDSLVEESTRIGRSGAVLNRLAAQTNAHYVVASDTIGRDVNSDFNKIVGKLMQTAYTQNLLFTRNIGINRVGTNIGVVRVPDSPSGFVNVTVTVSLSAVDVNVPQLPVRLFLGFKPNGNNTQTKSIDFLQTIDYANSNFYITTIQLEAGYDRELFLQYVAGPDQSDLLIRMWIASNSYHHAGYVGLEELHGFNELPEVTEYTGAAMRMKLFNDCYDDKIGTLLITDCNGEVSAKYDADQICLTPSIFTDEGSYVHYPFVPFFCDTQPANPTCVNGAESKYDAQFVAAGFSVTRSFQCRKGEGAVSANCQLKDSNGNYQCSGAAPFMRGPTGQVRDCSNHGRLEYDPDDDDYACQCDVGYSGESCEGVECSNKNVDPLAVDNSYHTYTVVLEISDGPALVLQDAKDYFGLADVTSLDKIWKYQLLTYCPDGSIEMIYSGGDIKAFQDAFNVRLKDCSVRAAGSVDLTNVYTEAVRGIGRNVKGVIVYFSEVSNVLNVTLDDFVSASQSYKQQLFVYALDDLSGGGEIVKVHENLAKAAMTTGGFLIQSLIDGNEKLHLEETFIPTLLKSSSSIAWYSSSQTADFSYLTDKDSYLISWKAGNSLTTANSWIPSCETADNTMAFCKLTGQSSGYTVKGNLDSGAYYVAVYVLDDVAPQAILISDLGQDAANAVSTSTSDTRTILSIRVPDGYTIVGNDNDGGVTRSAQREGCSFGWTSYSVFNTQKYTVGANVAMVTLQNISTPSKKYTRFFAFGTSSAPRCENGGTIVTATGSCSCAPGFQGPDCSLVDCHVASSANAWSDVCVCSAVDDLACATQYSPKKNFFHDSFCQHPQWTYTFFFAYSIELNADVFNSIVPIITNALSSYPYQGNILRDAFLDDSDERIRLPKDIDAFHADLVANPPIPKRPLDWTLPSNIVQIIENFFPTAAETSEYSGKTSVWLENSILLLLPVFVGGPYPDLSQSNYTSLINQNVKVFVLMNKDSSSNIYDRSFFPNLAARTNGHFVYADEEKFGDVTAHLMDSGYGKDLLYSRNCMMGRGKWHKGIGKFQTPKQHANGLVNVTVTLTDVSINVDDIGLNSFQVRFNIEQNNTNYTVSLVFIPGTNFHYATVQLPADTLFSLDAIMNALDPLYPIEVMMRMWIDRKYSQYAEYVDLDFRPTNPDDREGAALRMTVLNNCYQEERATVRFQNCDGEEDRVYETTQVTGIPIGTEGSYPKFASVPFFCPPSRACDVSYDTIYNVQLTVGEFSITRSFRCLDGVEPVKVGCSHLDLLGNYYCTRDALPYKRVTHTPCRNGDCLGVFAYIYSTDFSTETFAHLQNTLFGGLAKRYYYGDYVLGRIDTDPFESPLYPNNLNRFMEAIDANSPNKSISAANSSGVIPMLKEVLRGSRLKQNAMFLASLTRLPDEGEDLSAGEYEQLTIWPVQVFFLLDKSALEGANDEMMVRLGVLNKIAAVSNGHLIVIDDPDSSASTQSVYINIVSILMKICYNGNLLFTRNIGSAHRTNNLDLGTLMIPESSASDSNYVNVYISASGGNFQQIPDTISVDFRSKGNTSSSCKLDIQNGSNFYYCSISLPGGQFYDVTLNGNRTDDLLVRLWTDTVTQYQATFLMSRDSCKWPCYPNELNGAELYFQLRCPTEEEVRGELLITDCNGRVSSKYDAHQVIPYDYMLFSTTFWFAPFFCDTLPAEPTTCVAGVESKYDVQFLAGRFSYVRSFLCRPGVGTVSPDCTDIDRNGNHICSKDDLPYKRGPLGQLIDCLGKGFLAHYPSSNGFFCVCDPGFTGVSCEVEI